MRKVKMRVRWMIEEVIEVELDEDLPDWRDDQIVDELKYTHVYSGEIEPPWENGEVDEVDVADTWQVTDRKVKAIWEV